MHNYISGIENEHKKEYNIEPPLIQNPRKSDTDADATYMKNLT